MVVLLTCKNKENPIKNEGARVLTTLYIDFSSPEPKAQGELIVYRSSRRLSVCLAVSLWTFSNSNISATSKPIVTKS